MGSNAKPLTYLTRLTAAMPGRWTAMLADLTGAPPPPLPDVPGQVHRLEDPAGDPLGEAWDRAAVALLGLGMPADDAPGQALDGATAHAPELSAATTPGLHPDAATGVLAIHGKVSGSFRGLRRGDLSRALH